MIGLNLKAVMALAGALAIAAVWLHGNTHGKHLERTTWQAKFEQARAKASQAARQTEQHRYGSLLNALNEQFIAQRGIADQLHADLERLRKRPAIADRVPADPASPRECQAADGAELAREYAEVLARRAALSAEYDGALAVCQAYADSLQE